MKGQITKGIAGFYYVKSGETVYRCKARGLFKAQDIKPAVGDLVEMEVIEGNDDSLITEILPRKNVFIRPFVANVDCFVIVTAALRPAPVPVVLDKLLVMAEQAGTEAILCINKCDLAEDPSAGRGSRRKAEENIARIQANYGGIYPVITLASLAEGEGEGFRRLRQLIAGKTVALAGASGVGKSTILNRLLNREQMETGRVSEKTQRGRHTTRHAELFLIGEDETAVFDTPGFTSFAMPQVAEDQLDQCFPEFAPYLGSCQYDDCRHRAEPDCSVKAAVEAGKISRVRYESYLSMLRELEESRKY